MGSLFRLQTGSLPIHTPTLSSIFYVLLVIAIEQPNVPKLFYGECKWKMFHMRKQCVPGKVSQTRQGYIACDEYHYYSPLLGGC